MYSIVVMAALTASAEAPDRGCRGGRRHSCASYSYSCAPVYYHGGPRVIIYPGRPGPRPVPPRPGGPKKTGLDGDDTYVAETAAPATIVVRTPADATLTFDGERTQSIGTERRFETVALKPGTTYTYTLEAMRVVDGERKTVKQTVELQAGKVTEVRVEFPAVAVTER